MAKIIDPFGPNEDDKKKEAEAQIPELDQLQSFVSDLMSSLGISPSDMEDVVEPVTLALVLRGAHTLSPDEVGGALKRVFGAEAEYIGSRGTPTGSSVHLVEIEGFSFLVSTYVPADKAGLPPQLQDHPMIEALGPDTPFLIIEPNAPFGEDEAAVEDIEVPEDEEAFGDGLEPGTDEDNALAEAELLEDDEDLEEEEEPWTLEEGFMAKLLAEFIDDRVESIYVVTTGEALAYSPFMKDLLRGPDPMYYFLEKEVPIREFEADDPRLAAAAIEARARFNEFRKAFDARDRNDDESIYAVKIAITEDESVEHMWLNVSEIDGNDITGELANEPRELTEVELGDEISTTVEEIEDWVVQKGSERLGGFSFAVLFGGGEPPEA